MCPGICRIKILNCHIYHTYHETYWMDYMFIDDSTDDLF